MTERELIEEMAKVIQDGELDRNRGDLDCSEFPTDIVIKVGLQRLAGAKALYNAWYRKIPEGAVVLTREEFERWHTWTVDKKVFTQSEFYTRLKYSVHEARKETAREILKAVRQFYGNDYTIALWIESMYGVR